MKLLLSLLAFIPAFKTQAAEFYKYKACQFDQPQKVQLDPNFPGLSEAKSQLNMRSVYTVNLMGNTADSHETPYVLLKDAAGKTQAIRVAWLTTKSANKIMALNCKNSSQATQEFQNAMNAIDEKAATSGIMFKIEDCVPTGGSGVYQVCVPLVIMDYDRNAKTGGFSTVKCLFSATTSAAEKTAHVISGPPASVDLVHYRVMADRDYNPQAPVYQVAYSAKSQKFKDVVNNRPFACQNVDVGHMQEQNPTATSATVR